MPKYQDDWDQHPELLVLNQHVDKVFDEQFRRRYSDSYANCIHLADAKYCITEAVKQEIELLKDLLEMADKLPELKEPVIWIEEEDDEVVTDS